MANPVEDIPIMEKEVKNMENKLTSTSSQNYEEKQRTE